MRTSLAAERRPDVDIQQNLASYFANGTSTARHRSFDHCFNHFRSMRALEGAESFAGGRSLEASCMRLGFYLASWGMYRGSAELLQHSARALVPVIKTLAEAPGELWDIDAGDYSPEAIALLLRTAGALRDAFPGRPTDTLITKTMLGTFGCVPAFDQYFRRGFGIASLGRKSLLAIDEYARSRYAAIERCRASTLDFLTDDPTEHRYSRAKVIDMVFFIEGGGTLGANAASA